MTCGQSFIPFPEVHLPGFRHSCSRGRCDDRVNAQIWYLALRIRTRWRRTLVRITFLLCAMQVNHAGVVISSSLFTAFSQRAGIIRHSAQLLLLAIAKSELVPTTHYFTATAWLRTLLFPAPRRHGSGCPLSKHRLGCARRASLSSPTKSSPSLTTCARSTFHVANSLFQPKTVNCVVASSQQELRPLTCAMHPSLPSQRERSSRTLLRIQGLQTTRSASHLEQGAKVPWIVG